MRTVLQYAYRYWMVFARTLGKINSVIILTLLFFVVVGPYALVKKTIRMMRTLSRQAAAPQTYWVDKKARPATLEEMKRQF